MLVTTENSVVKSLWTKANGILAALMKQQRVHLTIMGLFLVCSGKSFESANFLSSDPLSELCERRGPRFHRNRFPKLIGEMRWKPRLLLSNG